MKLYNPSSTNIPNIFENNSEILIPGGANITIDDDKGNKLLETYGFLVEWTNLPNCPTFKSDNYEDIKRIKTELIEEQKKQILETQKKIVFGSKDSDKLKIFISFKDEGEDLTIASQIDTRVKELGYQTFFFKHSHLPSEKIGEIIPKLQSSNLVVVILSNRTSQSSFIVQEIGIAVAEGIPIFPIAIERLDSFDIGFFRDTNADRYDSHHDIEQTIKNFNKVLAKYFVKT